MPYHRIPRASIHEDLRQIEREGERVVSASCDEFAFHVFTVFQGDRIERRPRNINVDELAATIASDPLAHAFLTDDIVRRDG